MTKKYLLSEKYKDLAIDFEELKEFFATEKMSNMSLKDTTHMLGISSLLLNIPIISLYDQEDLVKKFPNGVVTENFILIPAELFEKIKEQATKQNNQSYDTYLSGNFALFLNQNILSYLEVALNIELPAKDREQLEQKVQNKYTSSYSIAVPKEMIINYPDKQVIKISELPEKSTNREVLKLIEGKGYNFETVAKKQKTQEQEIKEILKTNINYITGIEILENKAKEVKIKETDGLMSIEEFNKLIQKTIKGTVTPLTSLKIVKKKIDNLINETDYIKNFIQEAEEKIVPFMIQLEPLQFKLSMEHIYKEVFNGTHDNVKAKNFEDTTTAQLRQDFAVMVDKYLNDIQHSYLITVITGFDELSSGVVFSSGRKLK